MKYETYYRQRIPNLPFPKDNGEVQVACLFHTSGSHLTSLSVNLINGKFRCFSPNCIASKGGTYKRFGKLLSGEVAGVVLSLPHIPREVWESHHHILSQNKDVLKFLGTKRGILLETVKRFKLGWDSERIWIPIFDKVGNCINVRKYLSGAKDLKMVPYAEGYNMARLFPVENLASDWVLLCEGEMDCILACQYGYPAITATGGAGTWTEDFTLLLTGKRVVVCYDTDKAGKDGARQVATKLLGKTAEVRIARLPLAGTKEEKDITNYLVDLCHSKQDFDAVIAQAELVELKVQETAKPSDDVTRLHLSEVGRDEFVGKRVETNLLVAGKDLAPFQVPYKIAFKCDAVGTDKLCERCGICRAGGQREVQVPEYSSSILEMVNVPSGMLESILAGMAGVPDRCRRYTRQVLDYVNVEAIKAIPEIDFAADTSTYVIRQLFFLGHGLDTNHTYKVAMVVMPDPKTQYGTALIYEAIAAQDSVEKFDVDATMGAALRVFQVGHGL